MLQCRCRAGICTKYMNQILELNIGSNSHEFSGSCLDSLRIERGAQLTFAPDPSTHNAARSANDPGTQFVRDTLAARGKTVDNVEELRDLALRRLPDDGARCDRGRAS